ncbi:MAG: DUF4287 domain-containing protein [Acidobacteriaceae bacterium]|nr:DUF4287 domain-containing protein [Acidobacteriaceae bacterium]MBV8571229.1 DUF4287 domain-containing protein [Acidobacteriaceae bacterium]
MPTRSGQAQSQTSSPYSLHPGFAREAAVIAKFKEKTGKTFQQWVELAKKSGPPGAGAKRDWLKTEHGLTTNYAMFVAETAEGRGGSANYHPDDLVNQIFAGPKEHLRPLYEEVLNFGLALGKDVKVCPCATIIPFYRKHVFAQVKVPNRSRIDLGFAFGDLKAEGKLIDTGGFAKKDRITHRIELSSAAEFDSGAQALMRRAYEMDGN